jgi:hypothetical protein
MAAISLALAGCAPGYYLYSGTVTTADVLGTWTSDCGASMTLASHDRLTATDFPTAWDARGNPTKTFSGPSDWNMESDGDMNGNPGIEADIGDLYISIDFASVGGKLGLAYDIMYDDQGDEEYCIFSRR